MRVESRCVVTAKHRVHRSSRKSICTRSQRKPKICTPLSTYYKVTDLTDVTINSYTAGDFSLNTDFLDLIDAQPPYCQLKQVHVWNDPLRLSPPLVCAGFQRETSLASEAFSPMTFAEVGFCTCHRQMFKIYALLGRVWQLPICAATILSDMSVLLVS